MTTPEDSNLPILEGRALILLADDDIQDAVNGMKPQEHVISAEVHQVIESVPAKAVDGVYIKRRLIWISILGAVVLIAIVVGVSVGVSRKSDNKTSSDAPMSTFSLPPPIERFAMNLPDYTQETLQQDLSNATTISEWYKDKLWSSNQEFTPHSAQGKAWKWLVSDPKLASRSLADVSTRFALATLYYATDGPNWINSTNWLSMEADVCTWWFDSTGVAASADYSSNLEFCLAKGFPQLLLMNNGLAGTIPPELALLTNLMFVKLLSNSLHSEIPAVVWESWSAAKTVDLHDNSLSGALPTILGLLTGVYSLSIQNNQFSGSLPPEIGNLRLTFFQANSNALTGSIPDAIKRVKGLQTFMVANNTLTGTLTSALVKFRGLYTLDVSRNRFSGRIPSEVGSCRSLRFFSAADNALTGSIPSEFSRLPELQYIYVNNNSLTGSLPSRLGKSPSLLLLDATSNLLSGTVPDDFGMLSRLQTLQIADTNVSGSIPTSVCELRDLADTEILINCSNVECNCNCTCA